MFICVYIYIYVYNTINIIIYYPLKTAASPVLPLEKLKQSLPRPSASYLPYQPRLHQNHGFMDVHPPQIICLYNMAEKKFIGVHPKIMISCILPWCRPWSPMSLESRSKIHHSWIRLCNGRHDKGCDPFQGWPWVHRRLGVVALHSPVCNPTRVSALQQTSESMNLARQTKKKASTVWVCDTFCVQISMRNLNQNESPSSLFKDPDSSRMMDYHRLPTAVQAYARHHIDK